MCDCPKLEIGDIKNAGFTSSVVPPLIHSSIFIELSSDRMRLEPFASALFGCCWLRSVLLNEWSSRSVLWTFSSNIAAVDEGTNLSTFGRLFLGWKDESGGVPRIARLALRDSSNAMVIIWPASASSELKTRA